MHRKEFCDFVKSLNIAAGVKIEEAVQNEVIDTVLQRSGVDARSEFLTYKDFEAIFNNIEDPRRPVGVHMRGVKLKINLDEFVFIWSLVLSETKTVV